MNHKEIKDAARQAFRDQQSQDTEGGVPDAISFIAGFLKGVRHLEAELDELTSILDLKKETIVEMQSAYETLQAHNEMLIATVDNLKEENRKLVDALKLFTFP